MSDDQQTEKPIPNTIKLAIALLLIDALLTTQSEISIVNSYGLQMIVWGVDPVAIYFLIFLVWAYYIPTAFLIYQGVPLGRWMACAIPPFTILTASAGSLLDLVQLGMDCGALFLLFTDPGASWFRTSNKSIGEALSHLFGDARTRTKTRSDPVNPDSNSRKETQEPKKKAIQSIARNNRTAENKKTETVLETEKQDHSSTNIEELPFYRRGLALVALLFATTAFWPAIGLLVVAIVWTGDVEAYDWRSKDLKLATKNYKIAITALVVVTILINAYLHARH